MKRSRSEFVRQFVKPQKVRKAERIQRESHIEPVQAVRSRPAKSHGMTVKQVANLSGEDISKMSVHELRSVINTAGKSLNKRLSNIEKNKLSVYSPAYKRVAENTGGKARFSSKGKNVAQLRHEVAEIKHLAGMKTGTVKGSKVEAKRTRQALEYGAGLTGDQAVQAVRDFWDNFHRAREAHPELSSGQIFEAYQQEVEAGNDFTGIMDRLNEESEVYFESIAEDAQRAEEQFGFFGDPFKL